MQDCRWINEADGIVNYLVNNFTELFKGDPNEDKFCIMFQAPVKIDTDSNNNIAHVPTSEEIWSTIKRMKSLKSPGPDGMHALLYKRCRTLI